MNPVRAVVMRRIPAVRQGGIQSGVDQCPASAILGAAPSGVGRVLAGLFDLHPSRLARSGPAGCGPRLSQGRSAAVREAADDRTDRGDFGCAGARYRLSCRRGRTQTGGYRKCRVRLSWLGSRFCWRLAPVEERLANRRLSAPARGRSVPPRWVATWRPARLSAVPGMSPSARCIRTSAAERGRLTALATGFSTRGVSRLRGAPFLFAAPGARVKEDACSTRS